jgi:hypothetical protein
MIRPLLLLAVAAFACGCAQISLAPFGWSHKAVVSSPQNPVVEVMCLWEPAEGNDLNGLPCRGFAGQLLFFTAGNSEAAKVDGDIRIYVFDDVGDEAERSKPLHQFDFDSGSWNKLGRDGDLGMSYQIFVPYTRPGQFQANCSLRVRFTPKYGGSPIYSKMGPVALPGRVREQSVQQPQPEGYSVPSPAGAPARTESAPGGRLQQALAPGGVPVTSVPSFTLPNASAPHLRQQLSELQAVAAESAQRAGQAVEPQGRASLEPPADETTAASAESSAVRRTYRLLPD